MNGVSRPGSVRSRGSSAARRLAWAGGLWVIVVSAGACAAISGLDGYGAAACADACADNRVDGISADEGMGAESMVAYVDAPGDAVESLDVSSADHADGPVRADGAGGADAAHTPTCTPLDDTCAAGTYCQLGRDGVSACVAGCKADIDCLAIVDGGSGGPPGDSGPSAAACCNHVCVDTASDPINCAGCAVACSAEGGVPACCSSVCVDTAGSVANCGGCGQVCAPANVHAATCAASTCGYDACQAGRGDCDGNPANGCEADLSTDPAHCGTCSNVCSSGLCGTTIGGWGASAALWQLNGSASIATGHLGAQTGILTTAAGGMAGTIVYKNPVATDSFTATFSLYIGGGSGSDGMGFMLETTGPTALGAGGGCLGMCGLSGYGVEFDTWNNSACGDTNANHVGVDLLTVCNAYPTSLTVNNNLPFTFVSGGTHAAIVQLVAGAISLSLDGTPYISSYALPNFTAGAPYYYGFAGATGGSDDFHEVASQLSISFPTPRCL